MILEESGEYIHIETNYKANIIEIKGDIVGFMYFDESDDYETGEMTVEHFKIYFMKKGN